FTIYGSRLFFFFDPPDRAVGELDAREPNFLPARRDVARALVGADEHLLRERLRGAGGDLLLRLKMVALQLPAAVGVEEDVIPLDRLDGLPAGVLERQARRVLEDVLRPALDAEGDAGLPAVHHLHGRVAVVLPPEADDLHAGRARAPAGPLRSRERRQRAEQEHCFQRRSHLRAPRRAPKFLSAGP